MKCPKCGNLNSADDTVCLRCSYILNAGALLGLVDDDARDLEDRTTEGVEGSGLGDALLLGTLEGEHEALLSDATGDFLTATTGEVERIVAPAPVYIDHKLAAMLKDDTVLSFAEGVRLETAQLSPFEQHVGQFLNGVRPVARVRAKSGLSSDDLRIALAMMADKGLIKQTGVAKRRSTRPRPQEPAAEAPSLSAPPRTDPEPVSVRSQPPTAASTDPKKARARAQYETAMKDFAEHQRARGLMFAKMAASTDPDEPLYRALVEQWSHLESAPAKKTTEPEWVRLMGQAQSAEDAGDFDGAVSMLERALRARPDQATIHNRLGVLLATRKKEYQKAAEHLIRAVEMAPDNAVYTANLGKVLGLADDAESKGRVQLVVAKLRRRQF